MKRAGVLVVGVLGCLAMLVAAAVVVGSREEPLVDRVRVGAYVHLVGQPYRDPVADSDLAELEAKIGKLDLIHYFLTWGRAFTELVTPTLDDHDLMISLKPDGDLIERINHGQEDRYLRAFAASARSYGKPVYLRLGHEMNGFWMSYSSGAAGGPSAADYVSAWRHVFQLFRGQSATNVQFIWSPNESDDPDRDGNRMEDYWPGSEYVDIAGFDAYNWTDLEPRRGDGSNRTFEEIVREPYDRLEAIAPGKDIWLCEFGTVEPAKAKWFQDMFASREFPRLTTLVYFSEDDQRDTQRDWRIDSSGSAAAAWREARTARQSASSETSEPR